MNQELSKELRIITLRNGVELSMEKGRADKLLILMEQRKFLEIDGRVINTADIVGIFKPTDMEDVTRRKNGQWKCSFGRWHDKNVKCDCKFAQSKICIQCGKETGSFVRVDNGIMCVNCWKNKQ